MKKYNGWRTQLEVKGAKWNLDESAGIQSATNPKIKGERVCLKLAHLTNVFVKDLS